MFIEHYPTPLVNMLTSINENITISHLFLTMGLKEDRWRNRSTPLRTIEMKDVCFTLIKDNLWRRPRAYLKINKFKESK